MTEPAYGWLIDPLAAEARIQTRLGRLHLLAFPVPLTAGLAAPAGAPADGAGAAPRLIGLLSFIHPQRRLDLRHAHPTVYNVVVAEVAVAMQHAHLVQQLINEARWLEAVLQHTSDGLIILDPRGRVLGCNEASTQITGWSAVDLRGRDLELDPRSAPPGLDARRPHLRGGAVGRAVRPARTDAPPPAEEGHPPRRSTWC